jgi:putative membrane protein
MYRPFMHRALEGEATMRPRHRSLRACAIILPLCLGSGSALSQDSLKPDSLLRLPQPPGSALSAADRMFIDQAAGGANAAIAAGRLAERQARDEAVRQLGGEIAADQQALKVELARLSHAKGYHANAAAPNELAALARISETANDAEFDKRYLTAQYQASRWLVAAYQNESAATQDLELRTFSTARALTMSNHVEAIEKAAKTVGLQLEAPRNPPQY